ncbi:alpha/beta hydrolase fold protein [Haloterrigena turkmenica DSM 5511]|uniref:Alpha/beta hydrolase fold protein n=1 Tax=Haloterrigena turkmenica (strain ATCC 51198 / DSM 5511 / JCM 9101 / NCIMB 13204 / VKM B-1734 / 4k) TaxID=543526 RepID=D2RTX9_HALTV|nr:alpha/beta hydrolase [Haloterrigena turkmenica]ADB61080.1 alpha/beta hydrolase fold protein [Haloterrigena turkmenica DSM 5511]
MDYETWADDQETATVTVDEHDLEVAYYDDGDGEPVLFCHGIPTSSYLWRDVAPPLSDDYRVIAPDMVGYGNSAMHDGFDRSIRAQEAMIDGLVDELGLESITFVGHDLGGGVGLRYAAHNPDAVERLALSNAVCYDSWPIEAIIDLGLPSTIAEMSVDDARELLEDIFRDTRYDEPEEAFVDGMLAPWDSEEAVISLSRNAIGTNTSHTTEIDPSEITARTLLLWGAEDEFQPVEYAERLEDDIADAELVGLDEASHWVMADRPDAYAERLREFLDVD